MKKSLLHRISALALGVVMITTSLGFSIDMHYCGGKMKSYSLFGDAKSCYAIGDMVCYAFDAEDSDEYHQCNIQRKKCCENKTFVVQPVENLINQVISTAVDDLRELHTLAFTDVLAPEAKYFEHTMINWNYRPPLLLRTTPIFLQSFLI